MLLLLLQCMRDRVPDIAEVVIVSMMLWLDAMKSRMILEGVVVAVVVVLAEVRIFVQRLTLNRRVLVRMLLLLLLLLLVMMRSIVVVGTSVAMDDSVIERVGIGAVMRWFFGQDVSPTVG